MTTNHTGDGTGGFVNIYPLMVDSDSPSALLFRVPLEQIADNLKFLFDEGVSSAGGTIDSGETLTIEGDLDIDGPSGRLRILSGADFGINSGGAGAVASGASFQLQSGSDFIVAAGAGVDWAADVDVQAGSVWAFASTAGQTFAAGSVVTHESISGERYEAGSICLFESIDNPRIDADGFTWICSMVPQFITTAAGVLDWTPNAAGVYTQGATDGADVIGFSLPLLPGDTITTVVVRIDGGFGAGHAALPANPPVVELISVSSAGVVTVVATATDPVTFPAYDSPHSVTLAGGSLPFSVPLNARLLVRVTGENGANAVNDTTAILWVDGTGVANHFRNTSEVY